MAGRFLPISISDDANYLDSRRSPGSQFPSESPMFRTRYSPTLAQLVTATCLAIPAITHAQTLPINQAEQPPKLPVLIDGKPIYADHSRFVPADNVGQPAPTFLQQLQEYFQAATEAGVTTADNLGQFVSEKYEQATTSASGAATSSVNYINRVYERAVKAGDTSAKSAQKWVSDDIRKIGTWEYKVLSVTRNANAEEEALNELGEKRWECFSVTAQDNGTMVFHLKRPHRSYLQRLPAKELLRLAPMLDFGTGNPE